MIGRPRVIRVAHCFDGDQLRGRSEVYIRDGILDRILAVEDTSPDARALRERYEIAEQLDEPDGLLLPGLINSHHHCYSALARGLTLAAPTPDFPARLEHLWWRLDRQLDPEAIYLSALVTGLDSVRHGCTTVVDHHSSPVAILGSLGQVARAFGDLHLTGLLCFETSDRSGETAFEQSIVENLAFAEEHRDDPHLRGLLGLHASFTLSDASLTRLARERPTWCPIHVHVAEDRCDVEHARAAGYVGPLLRLHHHRLLDAGSVIGHGVHLTDKELDLAAEIGLRVAHNPESNCNNGVGYNDLDGLPLAQLLLGTDGMTSNLLGSLRAAYLLYCGLGRRGRDPLARARAILFENPPAYLSERFGRPVGRLVEGQPADLAVFRYRAPTPLTAENWLGHLLYGLAPDGQAHWVYANGYPMVEDGVVTGADEAAILAAARESAKALWARYAAG